MKFIHIIDERGEKIFNLDNIVGIYSSPTTRGVILRIDPSVGESIKYLLTEEDTRDIIKDITSFAANKNPILVVQVVEKE